MRNCPNEKELVLYAAGELPSRRRAALKAHVEGCAACRGEVAALERGLEALARLGPGPELSADALNRIGRRLRGRVETSLSPLWERGGVRGLGVLKHPLRRSTFRVPAWAGWMHWATAAAAAIVLGLLVWSAVTPTPGAGCEEADGEALLEVAVALELLQGEEVQVAPVPTTWDDQEALDEIEALLEVLSAEREGRS
jgi:anti-sigma factor RsiW